MSGTFRSVCEKRKNVFSLGDERFEHLFGFISRLRRTLLNNTVEFRREIA